MRKDGVVIVLFILITLLLFGLLIKDKMSPKAGKYEKEYSLVEISLENDLVKRAYNSISFNYEHSDIELEKKLYNKQDISIKDLSPEEKLLLVLNDLGYNKNLPSTCSTNAFSFYADRIKESIIDDLSFLKELTPKKTYVLGIYDVYYSGTSFNIKNNYCESITNDLNYVRLNKAEQSNKRLLLYVNYLYLEEKVQDDEVLYKAFKDSTKQEVLEEDVELQDLDANKYDEYIIEFKLIDNNIYFNKITYQE